MNSSAKTQTVNRIKEFNKLKKLPVGHEFFDEVIQRNFYYVDKTNSIAELLDVDSKVTLFTRPRRFGKTLNMSMLKHFFEIGSDPSLFDGLAIMQRKDLCEQHMGQYPVIFLTLKSIEGRDFDSAYNSLCRLIQRETDRLNYLIDSPSISNVDKQNFLKLLSDNPAKKDIEDSLNTLCTLLEKHHGQKTIILIDEYDVPLDKAYINGYYNEMIDLIRAMFGSAFKTNPSLQLAVLTGCLRVSKESVFTGLHNFRVCGISDIKFTECFGFTEAEVKEMFEYYSVENRMKDAKAWYDGYRFGNQEIYCPWDIISFCDDLRTNCNMAPKLYWINTSGNDIVRRLIKKSNSDVVKGEIENLINGGTIQKQLNLNITHREIDEGINNLWSLLYMTGYLTTTEPSRGDMFSLRIPNYEIAKIYMNQVIGWFRERVNAESKTNCEELDELFEAFLSGNAQDIKRLLEARLLTTASYFDTHENFYHGFLLALLSSCNGWYLTSNHESGTGRCDIIIQKLDCSFGAAIEVKALPAREFKKLDSTCAAAIKQINDMQYTAPLEELGVSPILKYGIAFAGKRCKVVVEKE